jgi:hypothetical protein
LQQRRRRAAANPGACRTHPHHQGRTPDGNPQSIIDAIVAPFTAAAEIATAIDTVATLLDGARTVVLIVENTTHHNLELVASGHDHGGFDVTPATILPKLSTAVFSSKDRGVMTGTNGWVRYRVKDQLDEETKLQVNWSNPFVGSNHAGAMAYYDGPPMPPPVPPLPLLSTYYRATAICGAGDQKAEMRYSLKRL